MADASRPETQGVGPYSSADYRNGSDIESDNAYYDRVTQQALRSAGPGLSDSATDAEVMAYRMRDAGFDGEMTPTGARLQLSPGSNDDPRVLELQSRIARLSAISNEARALGASMDVAISDRLNRESVIRETVTPIPGATDVAGPMPVESLTLDLPSLDSQIAATPSMVIGDVPAGSDVSLPLVNPGSGLGVYLGALSSTDAMYTRSPASGAYGSLRVPGYQAHHLNQNAVYKIAIPPANGQSILLRGNAFIDAGSSHFEAHASVERWWDSYRAGGEMVLQRPTNAQYGEALKQSLIDAGMSPSDAAQHAEAARQQRLASGLAEEGLVPRVPRRINQPGTNVVDADLWAARGLAKNLAIAGRGLTAVGVAFDGYSLYSQYQQSAKTGDYSNTYREGVRVAGGWAGAYAVGTAGAEFGAAFGMAFSPVGAVVGGFVGGLIGGGIGYFGGSYASVGIATDLGLLPPGVRR